jgi:hypothetical protein
MTKTPWPMSRHFGQRLVVIAAVGIVATFLPGNVAAAQVPRPDVVEQGTTTPDVVGLGIISGPAPQQCNDPDGGGCPPPPDPNLRGSCISTLDPLAFSATRVKLHAHAKCQRASGNPLNMHEITIDAFIRVTMPTSEDIISGFTPPIMNSPEADITLDGGVLAGCRTYEGTANIFYTLPPGWHWVDPNFDGIRNLKTKTAFCVHN